jgi:hypothetical protein
MVAVVACAVRKLLKEGEPQKSVAVRCAALNGTTVAVRGGALDEAIRGTASRLIAVRLGAR